MAAGYEMRVSDAEREAAAAELREHFASGRLNQDELNDRLSAAFAAKTRGDLNAIFTDLPSSGHGWAKRQRSRGGPDVGARALRGRGCRAGARGRSQGASDDATGKRAATPGGPAAGRSIGRIAATSVLVWVLFIVGILGVFGIGTGRPFGVVLIIAAFALLRRLLFMIFGRRMRRRGRGPPPHAASRSGLRWSHLLGDKITVRDLSWKGPNFQKQTGSAMAMRYYAPFPSGGSEPPRPLEDRTRCASGTRNATLRRQTLASTTRLAG